MPVTKTAKRAQRGSIQKAKYNALVHSELENAIRGAKKGKTQKLIQKAVSLADRAAKRQVIHKNKAARIKSALSKLGRAPKKTK